MMASWIAIKIFVGLKMTNIKSFYTSLRDAFEVARAELAQQLKAEAKKQEKKNTAGEKEC